MSSSSDKDDLEQKFARAEATCREQAQHIHQLQDRIRDLVSKSSWADENARVEQERERLSGFEHMGS